MLESVTSVAKVLGSAQDIDLRPDGSWIGLFRRPDGLHVSDSNGRSFTVHQPVSAPILRALGLDRVVLVDSRPLPTGPGGFIISLQGQLLHTFSVGDGIQDVIVLDDTIVVTYFDEGIFSGVRPADEGIAFFDLDGVLFGGYQSVFGAKAVDIADCYAACPVGRNQIAFTAYTGFELVFLNPRACMQEVQELPKELHGASGLSICGEEAYLYGPSAQKRALLSWRQGKTAQCIGEHAGPLRGLPNGRFLARSEHGFTVMDCTAAE